MQESSLFARQTMVSTPDFPNQTNELIHQLFVSAPLTRPGTAVASHVESRDCRIRRTPARGRAQEFDAQSNGEVGDTPLGSMVMVNRVSHGKTLLYEDVLAMFETIESGYSEQLHGILAVPLPERSLRTCFGTWFTDEGWRCSRMYFNDFRNPKLKLCFRDMVIECYRSISLLYR